LSGPKGKKIQVEEVIIEAGIQGLSEAEVIATIDSLKRDRLVREPEIGFIQLI